MSYRIKRIDPFWLTMPLVPAFALAGGAAALLAARAGLMPVAMLCAAASGIAVFLATKPALSGVFAVFGLLGGVVTFLLGSGGGLALQTRALATVGFSLFYMLLMDVVALSVCVLYNFFTKAGLPGVALGLKRPV